MSLLQKLHCLVCLDLLSCVGDFLHIRFKYRARTLALIPSGDVHGASGLIVMYFDLRVCQVSLSVVWYCLHNCYETSLG